MQIDTHIIDQYLTDKPLNLESFPFPIDRCPLDPHRKEVVLELKNRTKRSLTDFPNFNKDLYTTLFPSFPKYLENTRIILLVGSKHFFRKFVLDQNQYYVIDLIQCANMTSIVSQMMYLILHTLHYEMTCSYLKHVHPFHAPSYKAFLNYHSFIEGFATYLSWNEQAKDYHLYTDHYDQAREKAFGTLYETYFIDSPNIQQTILHSLSKLSFWDQFTTISALFYIDDIYREHGKDGLRHLYLEGWSQWIETIFALPV